MSEITASYYSSSLLSAIATNNAELYARTAYNVLNPSISTAANIGTLKNNTTQLNVEGALTTNNPKQFYKFSLDGEKIKLSLDNLTTSADLRVQLLNSKGTVIADNQGSTELQTAYTLAITSIGLTAQSGDYYAVVSYSINEPRANTQEYSLNLYSGTQFSESYLTTAKTQNKATTYVPTDNTMTYATYDAQLYSRNAFHVIGEKVAEGVNIGWIYENKTSLSVNSQVTAANSTGYYQFTLQKGDNLKMAFNNSTQTSDLRLQIMDASGLRVIADNYGTTAQKEAYSSLISSDGMVAKAGNYSVKVTYAPGADTSKTQTYDFQLYSGTHFENSYETIASAQTLGNAMLTGNTSIGDYNAKSAIASYLTSEANGETTNIFQVISSYI
ncbi:MAG: hypothetical protein ABTQ34_09560 [Bdellovibrionales bacterium]